MNRSSAGLYNFFAIVLISLVLGSCSPGPGSGGTVFGDHLRYDSSKPVAGGREVNLVFWTQVDYESVYRKLAEDYMAYHPQVTINLVAFDYNDYFNTLLLSLKSGIGPDLFHMHNKFTQDLKPFIAPYPEDQLPLADLVADFRQVGSHVESGRVSFIDTVLMSSSILYNKAHWREAGLSERDIPRTWDELRAVARVLTRRGPDGTMTRSGFNPNGIGFSVFTAMNLQKGQEPLRSAVPGGPVLATEVSQVSLDYLLGFYNSQAVADPTMAEFHESFGMGESSMVYAWGWVNNWLGRNFPELEYGSFPTPTWTLEPSFAIDRNNGESSLCVNQNAQKDRQEVAFDLVCFFLASDTYLLEIARQFSSAPAKRSLDAAWAVHQATVGTNWQTPPDKTIWPRVVPEAYEKLLSDLVIDPVVIDGVDPATVLERAEPRVRELISLEPGF